MKERTEISGGIMPGDIVLSVAGRDSGRLFLVTAELDGGCVAIADGKIRRIENPKKKKQKHLLLLNDTPRAVLFEGMTNGDVRRAIKAAELIYFEKI